MLHHKLFLRPDPTLEKELGKTKLIVVGSFRSGGAGKTPFCLWLANHLAKRNDRIAILCHKSAFDEIQFYKAKLKNLILENLVEIKATGNRHKTTQALCAREHFDYIICDDGFEDSRLTPHTTFRLDWEQPPTSISQIIPAGKFRSLAKDHADKSSHTVALNCENQTCNTNADLTFTIKNFTNSEGQVLTAKEAIVICGLGDSMRFIQDIKAAGIEIQKSIFRPDHDKAFSSKISKVIHDNPEKNIIISEKDYARLSQSQKSHSQIYVARQTTHVSKQALLKIENALKR